jgi:hypothetical protein
MDYNTFQRINVALGKYITEQHLVMCSPYRIRTRLIRGLSLEATTDIVHHYRLYLKGQYSLNRLIIMIILYKYGRNTIFENCKGDCTRVDYISYKKQLNYEIIALEKFMLEY